MRDKILIAVIFMMTCLLLVPPMFAEGFIFDATMEWEMYDGSIYIEHGVYFDNVFNTILLLLMSFLGLIIPYFKPNLNKNWKRISTACGAWFVAGLTYEVLNFAVPTEVFNNIADNWTYIKYAIIFTLGLTLIITHETWNKQKS